MRTRIPSLSPRILEGLKKDLKIEEIQEKPCPRIELGQVRLPDGTFALKLEMWASPDNGVYFDFTPEAAENFATGILQAVSLVRSANAAEKGTEETEKANGS